MNRLALILILVVTLVGCSSSRGTIGDLRKVEIFVGEEDSSGSLDKAIESYEQFLEKTEETPLTPEAIRRLADLKVEKEYGVIADAPKPSRGKVEPDPPKKDALSEKKKSRKTSLSSKKTENQAGEKKGTSTSAKKARGDIKKSDLPSGNDLERAGAAEAVALYQKLLDKYPEYSRNDQALYQLSRAQEEQGLVEESMKIMNRLVEEFPKSRYLDEVQFRRGEYFFTRRKYVDASKAYKSVVSIGEKSEFYPLALYKLGWSFYKRDLYEEALHKYIALLDYRVANRFDFENIADDQEGKRVNDTLRSISQSFSSLGGAEAVVDYFSRYRSRAYEDVIYANLAEYYFSKQRYSDAVKTYATFAERNPFHRQAPLFALRVIAINEASGFASLVIKAKKQYARSYAFGADYWKHFSPDYRPDVVVGLKTNLIDLANHYHALYQDKKFAEKKSANLKEALYWYQEFLSSFARVAESPAINYQLAELLLENDYFGKAAREYEKTAYDYPLFEKADKAGYAAVYAYRQHLKQVDEKYKVQVKRDVIRVSIKFAEFFPKHKKAALVLSAAVDDLYALKDYKSAQTAARELIEHFPDVSVDIRRSALLVVAHSSFELESNAEAEAAYTDVLELLPKDDVSRSALVDNLVASIYRQGEAENNSQNYKRAAEHFLRVAKVAPTSKLRPTAEYDGAVALIKVEEWQGAAAVLTGFRKNFPKHELQNEVTKKLAYVYRQDERLDLAAVEFERIETESTDPALRQEALITAAELYDQLNKLSQAEKTYRSYVAKFPKPTDVNIEARDKLAAIYQKQGKRMKYLDELEQIVAIEDAAGADQTGRTRQIAGKAALILAKRDYDEFIAVRLIKPFKENLQRKQVLMKRVTAVFSKLFEYEDGEVTSAATFYLADIYADFSDALLKSERPKGLSPLELEEYELALEEQAYPFEEKAIETHQSNLELMSKGIYSDWIEKSLEKLAIFIPARYAKGEVNSNEIASMTEFRFENAELNLKAQKVAGRSDVAKTGRMKAEKHQKEDPPRVVVSRLGEGLTGFVVHENYQYDANQRDLFVLGVDALRVGEYDVAVNCFKALTETKPIHSAPYINLAKAYLGGGRGEQAEEPLKKALELVPGHPLASQEYGLLLRRAGRFDEAQVVYRESLRLFPEYFPLHKNFGVLCDLYLDDRTCASRHYQLLLEAQPEDEQVKLWLTEVQGR